MTSIRWSNAFRTGHKNIDREHRELLDAITSVDAELTARRFKKSRSQLYSEAIVEYLERHAPDAITESMNRVWEKLGPGEAAFVSAAAGSVLGRESW